MATHSSTLAWEITWMEKPGGIQSTESQRVRYNLATKQQQTVQTHHHLPVCSLLCFSPFLGCVLHVAPMKPLSFHWAMWTGDWRGRRAELRFRIFSLNSLIKRGGGSMESSSSR